MYFRASMAMTLMCHWALGSPSRAESSGLTGMLCTAAEPVPAHVDQPGAVVPGPAASACLKWDSLFLGGELCRRRAPAVRQKLRRLLWYRLLSLPLDYICVWVNFGAAASTVGYPTDHERLFGLHRSGGCPGVSSLCNRDIRACTVMA